MVPRQGEDIVDAATIAVPEAIAVSPDRRTLTVRYADGRSEAFTAEFLRVLSPSAEVRGHGEADRQTVPSKRGVTIAALEPVGNYAVRIVFADGHNTGLFSWEYLAELARGREPLWNDYLAALAARGLSRD